MSQVAVLHCLCVVLASASSKVRFSVSIQSPCCESPSNNDVCGKALYPLLTFKNAGRPAIDLLQMGLGPFSCAAQLSHAQGKHGRTTCLRC